MLDYGIAKELFGNSAFKGQIVLVGPAPLVDQSSQVADGIAGASESDPIGPRGQLACERVQGYGPAGRSLEGQDTACYRRSYTGR